ncbi:hypothetical protein [Actinoplanes sp. NPDC051859]|uniref:hypothetical protein n=1 Tax=Actinoplanes sp. NPDC051859 TaxID=3363909 RepID=UPI0037AF6B36
MNPTIARRFPLIARPRPACTPLPQRVAALRAQAADVSRSGDIAAATAVFNLAALLASDCGLPDLARQWCHRLARTTLAQRHDGRYALEPIVNLARLHTRAGNGTTAWTLLETLYHAVTDRTDITIDGIDIPTTDLTTTSEAHHELRAWLWTVLLSTGAHALAAAERWDDAFHRLAQHRGIGHRMLDGRQIAVITHLTAGRHDPARTLVQTTRAGEPWEAVVTRGLHLLCTSTISRTEAHEVCALYLTLDPHPAHTVFRTRLGLTLVDALNGHHDAAATRLTADLIHHALQDGYAARDVLAHPASRSVASAQNLRRLTGLLDSCGLDRGELPKAHLAPLAAALDAAEQVLSPRPGSLPR